MFGLFKKEKKADDGNATDNALEMRITNAINKAAQDKKNTELEIKKMKGFAADVIMDIYADCFPNANLSYYRDKYKVDAIEKYSQTKQQYAEKVGAELAEKCDKLVTGYLNQISLLESKLKLFDKMYNEYNTSLKKYKLAKAQSNKLITHQNRLDKMENDNTVLHSTETGAYELQDITNEVATREEYYKQLEQMNMEMTSGTDYSNALAYKQQVDNMLKE